MAKAKRVENWGDIDPKVFDAFYEAVEKLRDEMIPRDYDGDSPINYVIVNRMIHEPIGYFPVPRYEIYSYETHGYLKVHPEKEQELRDETERELTNNLHMAANAMERYMSQKYHKNRFAREAKRPIKDRIAETCNLCKKKMGFNPDEFNFLQLEKYPDYPSRIHTNGEKCEAFDLRRVQFNLVHPEYAGKPEVPQYCANLKCRCKLPGYNSKKGVNDKWVCVNCHKDNTKLIAEPVAND